MLPVSAKVSTEPFSSSGFFFFFFSSGLWYIRRFLFHKQENAVKAWRLFCRGRVVACRNIVVGFVETFVPFFFFFFLQNVGLGWWWGWRWPRLLSVYSLCPGFLFGALILDNVDVYIFQIHYIDHCADVVVVDTDTATQTALQIASEFIALCRIFLTRNPTNSRLPPPENLSTTSFHLVLFFFFVCEEQCYRLLFVSRDYL